VASLLWTADDAVPLDADAVLALEEDDPLSVEASVLDGVLSIPVAPP
jgi:hypothetical protein